MQYLHLRLGADSSADLVVYPAQLAGDPRVHPWGISLGTSKPPGDNTDDGVVVALVGDHGTTTVALTGVLVRVSSTYHLGGDVAGAVGRVGGALAIGHGGNIDL